MSAEFHWLTPEFALALTRGLMLNFLIALSALAVGILLGGVVAMAIHLRLPVLAPVLRLVLAVMRAVPVFIAMFFFGGVLRSHEPALAAMAGDAGVAYVVLACLPYAVSYVADQLVDALDRWRRGDIRVAILALPNIARAFQVLVASSCFGAAIGVPEAMSVILREADLLGPSPERWALFALSIVAFMLVMQVLVLITRLVHRTVDRQFAETPRPAKRS